MFYPYLPRLKVIEWSDPRIKIAESIGGSKILLPVASFSHPVIELDEENMHRGNTVLTMQKGRTDLINLKGSTVCILDSRQVNGQLAGPWFTLEEWVSLLDRNTVFGFWTQAKKILNPSEWSDPIIQAISLDDHSDLFKSNVRLLDKLCEDGANMRCWFGWRHPNKEWIPWIGPGVTVNHLREVPADVRMYDPRDLEMLL